MRQSHKHLRIGGLGPLSTPGIPKAGRELLDGMRLATRHINNAGGVGGRTLELIFEDTSGLPAAGLAAVARLKQQGVHALAGEYHSVVANSILDEVEHQGLPFVCASATFDEITSRRLSRIFRLAPPQSYGWRSYASYIISAGVSHVFAVIEDSLYWKAGVRVIESRLSEAGIPLTRLQIGSENGVVQAIEGVRASMSRLRAACMLLLLVGYPENLRSVLNQLRLHHLVTPSLTLGDPAGRTIFGDWWQVAGADAVGIPFLSYERPSQLSDRGESVAKDFEREYGREPSFVALEGYDSMLVLEAAVKSAGTMDPADVCYALRNIETEGTRGTIRFSTEPHGVVHQQWRWAPTCVVAFRHAHQPFSMSDILWDAELSNRSAASVCDGHTRSGSRTT